MGRPPRSPNRVPRKSEWIEVVNDSLTLIDEMLDRYFDGISAPARAELALIRAPMKELLVRAGIRG